MKNITSLLLLLAVAFVSNLSAQSGDPLPLQSSAMLVTGTTPTNGTNEVQTVTLTAFSSGTLDLAFRNHSTVLTFTGTEANAAIDTTVDAALEALPSVGTSGVSVVTSGTTDRAIAITFGGNLAKLDVPAIVPTVLTGANTVGIAITTPGVTADGRSAPLRQLLGDGAGILYINTSTTPLNPAWTEVGSQ